MNKSEPDTNIENNFELLQKALKRKDLFRFIIVQPNHFQVINQILDFLEETFPERPLLKITVEEEDYASLTQKIYNHQGIILIQDFDNLVSRNEIAQGFNQRRDKISQLPVQLLCFLPGDKQFLKRCAERIKDFWSVRDLILEFPSPVSNNSLFNLNINQRNKTPYLGDKLTFIQNSNFIDEINRLRIRINKLISSHENSILVNNLFEELTNYLIQIGAFEEALKTMDEWEEIFVAKNISKKYYINFLIQKGTALSYLNQYEQAEKIWKKALNLNEKRNNKLVAAQIKLSLGTIQLQKGNFSKALVLFEESKEIFQKFGDTIGLAKAYHNIGVLFSSTEKLEAALAAFETARTLEESLGNKAGLAKTLHQLGVLHQKKGNLSNALANFEASLELSQQMVDLFGTAISIYQIGMVYHQQGDHKKALTNYKTAILLFKDTGNLIGQASAYGQMGRLFLEEKDYENAFSNLVSAQKLFTEIGSPNKEKSDLDLEKLRKEVGENKFDLLKITFEKLS